MTLLVEVDSLKNPVAQDSHLGWAVVEPLALVYLPGGQLVWAVQASDLLLLGDVEALKYPGAHRSQDSAFFTIFSYVPGGQSIEVAWETMCNVTTTKKRVAISKKLGFSGFPV